MLERACALGNADATTAIVNWVHYGIHYTRDPTREYALQKLAAHRGSAAAHFALAAMCEGGVPGVVARNERRAFRHYLQSALSGDADAGMEVGRCYFYGVGTGQDLRLANIWRDYAKPRGRRFIHR